jgi:hypothetical protein
VELAERVARISDRRTGRHRIRACPDCAAVLKKVTPVPHLVLDTCSTHGTWFDADELAVGVAIAERRAIAAADDDARSWLLVALERLFDKRRREDKLGT